jgi:hypothetical protein
LYKHLRNSRLKKLKILFTARILSISFLNEDQKVEDALSELEI